MEMPIGTFEEGLQVGMHKVATSTTFVVFSVADRKMKFCHVTRTWNRRSRLLLFNVKKKLRVDIEIEDRRLDFAIMYDRLLLVRSNRNGRDSRGYLLLRSQREITWI